MRNEIDRSIKKVVIEQNPYHKSYFVRNTEEHSGVLSYCGGYETLFEEIVSLYCPHLDRFDDETKAVLMAPLFSEREILVKKLNFIMDKMRDKGKMQYTMKEMKIWLKEIEEE